jgi:gamma-glutamylcyclotransferase (GGCT)/AIG2-like uncharacterized protein YtfP
MADTLPVFVYGTLMPHGLYWPRISDWILYWEDAEVRGQVFDTGLGYPAAVFRGEAVVTGVLLHFRPDVLDRALDVIDEIEDEGHEYRRIEVTTAGGQRAVAYEWMHGTEGMVGVEGVWQPS